MNQVISDPWRMLISMLPIKRQPIEEPRAPRGCTPENREKLIAQGIETDSKILSAIEQHPGCGYQIPMSAIKKSKGYTNRRLGHLLDKGLIVAKKVGHAKNYWIST